jgi:hypothetical protein
MTMVCPQCKSSYEQQVECPVCQVRLTFPESRQPGRAGMKSRPADAWEQTPWGRLIGGILLAQGLYLGLVQVCLAIQHGYGQVFLDSGDSTLVSLVLRQVLQCVSLLLGGMLAGVGQRRGLMFGAVVGLWNSAIFFALQYLTGNGVPSVVLYAQPILQTAFGVLGGFVSSTIWKPPPALQLPNSGGSAVPLMARGLTQGRYQTIPLSWGRIAGGIALALGGTLWAGLVLDFALANAAVETTREQDWLVTWEISTLAIFVGAAFAGATTRCATSQGLVVGVGASTVLIGMMFGSGSRPWDPPTVMLLRSLHVGRELLSDPGFSAVLTAAWTIGLSVVAGWFGGQLFPPLCGPVRGRRRAYRQAALLE